MYVLICGGRDYTFTKADTHWLDDLHAQHHFAEVVTGGAGGAETQGRWWAQRRWMPVRIYHAEWMRYGKKAGPYRNASMVKSLLDTQTLEEEIAVIAFPGGPGTADCARQAQQAGIQVWRPRAQRDSKATR